MCETYASGRPSEYELSVGWPGMIDALGNGYELIHQNVMRLNRDPLSNFTRSILQ